MPKQMFGKSHASEPAVFREVSSIATSTPQAQPPPAPLDYSQMSAAISAEVSRSLQGIAPRPSWCFVTFICFANSVLHNLWLLRPLHSPSDPDVGSCFASTFVSACRNIFLNKVFGEEAQTSKIYFPVFFGVFQSFGGKL